MPQEVSLTPEQEAQYNQAAPSAQSPGTPVELTPEQQAQYNQPTALDPIKDFSSDQLFELAKQDPEFRLLEQFSSRPDLQNDPFIVSKVANAMHKQKLEPWYTGVSLGGMAKGVAGFGKGVAGQVSNVAQNAADSISMGLGHLLGADPATLDQLGRNIQQRVAESTSATEAATTGLVGQAVRLAKKVGGKSLDQYTEQDKVQALYDALADLQQQQKIATGHGTILSTVGPEVVKNLEQQGSAVRPERVATLAQADPFAFEAMGKGLAPLGKAAGALVPEEASVLAQRAAQATIGRGLQAAGVVVKPIATAVRTVAPTLSKVAGGAAGGVAAGELNPVAIPIGIVEGVEKGGKLGAGIARGADRVAQSFENLSDVGRQIAGAAPLKSSLAGAGQQIAQAAPRVIGAGASGAAFDIGLQAATAETPEERESFTPFGTIFGLAHGVKYAGSHVLSGLIAAPRDWGSNIRTPNSNNFPALNPVHDAGYAAADPGQKARVNALRQLVSGTGAELFYAPRPEEGQPDTLPDTLQGMGVPKDRADILADKAAFAADVNGKKVVVVRDVEAGPHDALHAIDDVVGATKVREMNDAVKDQYDPETWEAMKQRYASLIDPNTQNPGSTILQESGRGDAEAKEKIIRQVHDTFVQNNEQPTPEAFKQAAASEIQRQQADADAAGKTLWENMLTPEEQTNAVDQYMGDEVRAENFDSGYKGIGDGKTLPDKLTHAVASTMASLGFNPVAGRYSDLGFPLDYETMRQGLKQAAFKKPVVEPSKLPKVSAPVGSPAAATQQQKRNEEIVKSAPDVALPGATKSPREMMGILNEAVIGGTPVDIQYGHAGGTAPAAGAAGLPEEALGSVSRADRRDVIEAWRQLPISTRSFMATLFSPERFDLTKSGKYQVYGGSHAVLAANLQKLANFSIAHPDFALPAGWTVDKATGSFTPDAWNLIFDQVQKYSRNQLSGRAGSGVPLVVPKMKGYFEPPVTGTPEVIPQDAADAINAVYGQKTPETARISKKDVVPLNIAGQRISAATIPGRVEAPTAESPEFTGDVAKGLGIEGQHVLEPNPFLTELNKHTDAPSFIEARRRLNLDHMADVNHAPAGAPSLRGNTLTMAAGFRPELRGNEDIQRIAADYMKGKPYARPSAAQPVNEKTAKRIADFYQRAVHSPESPEVQKSYQAMADETVQQWNALEKAGYKMEPWTKQGQPYATSADMTADVRDNHHLWFFPTEAGYGEGQQILEHPLLKDSGITVDGRKLPYNDIFRAVHDVMGHAKEGYEFGPKGELNAYLAHSAMYSAEARPAMAAETLGQNSWVNFGQHLRNAEGNIPKKGEAGFVPAPERPFAEQKAFLLPENMQRLQEGEPKTFVVRHGTTEMNDPDPTKDLIRGTIDVPLDKQGKQEAQESAQKIADQGGVQTIVHSDLKRTRATAEAIAEKNPGAQVVADPRLQPWHFGPTIEGKPTQEMLPKIRELTENPDQRPPGGETFNEFKDRFLEGFHDNQSKYADQNTALVTHYRGTKLLDAWRATGVDNDTIDPKVFEEYDKSKSPGNIDIVDKTGAQFKPRKSKLDRELKETAQPFVKGWILPNGDLKQFGSTFHHDWLNENPDVMKRYGLKGPATDENRSNALQKGFVRVNYARNTGTLKIEARQQDWEKQSPSVMSMVRDNISKIDNMDVHLLDSTGKNIVVQDGVALHTYDPDEKLDHIPLITEPTPGIASEQLEPSRDAQSERLFNKASSEAFGKAQFRPSEEGDTEILYSGQGAAAGAGTGGSWFSSRPERAATFGPNISRVVVPREVAEAAREEARRQGSGTSTDFVLPNEWVKKAEPVTGIEQPVYNLQFRPDTNPRAVRIAAVHDEDTGKTYEGPMHALAKLEYLKEKHASKVDEEGNLPDSLVFQAFQAGDPNLIEGYVTNEGKFLNRAQALQRAIELGQYVKTGNERGLESGAFTRQQELQNQGYDLNKVAAQFKPTPSAKPEDFKSEETLPRALASPNWAIFSATKEDFGPGTNEHNTLRNENMEKALIADGFLPVEVKGSYKGVDQGKNFLVPNMTPEQAHEWGNKYGQESVLTPQGLLYNDGTVNPIKPEDTVIGKDAEKQDFHTRVEDGTPFSVGIDFDKRVPAQFKPNTAAPQKDLLGEDIAPRAFSKAEVMSMSNKELAEHYPEAVIPNRKRNQKGQLVEPEIPSDIVHAPLVEANGGAESPKAIKTFAGKLVDFANQWKDHPSFKAGMRWYSDFVPKLRAAFGKNAQLFAELLAATSPNNPPETNFAFAYDALRSYEAGRFDKQLAKFNEGLKMADEDTWQDWYNKTVPKAEQPAKPTKATFLAEWIDHHDLKPRQSNGKLYSMHSVPVLQVFARRWLSQTTGPKTQNFIKNLIGAEHEATIDVWADRTMRRLGYQDYQDRWRILPKNATGIPDSDFHFSQKVFRAAADQMGIKPDALQGALWFAEKQLWSDKGWGRLDLGDYSKEMERVPELQKRFEQRNAQQEMNLVAPRPGM